MSEIGQHTREPMPSLTSGQRASLLLGGLFTRGETPIVPGRSIAGRALVAVIAIMSFLASLTIGAVLLVRAQASQWQADVAREVTIQVRPVSGRNIDVEVKRAVELASAVYGVGDVRAFSREESAALLEPWLGGAMTLDDLPVPRMIVVKLTASDADLSALKRALSDRVAGATLDDHRAFMERMRSMARTTIAGGLGLLVLMLAATVLSVTFATRGAMAANRPIVEVLHYVGAKSGFIAGHIQRHFFLLGLQGGAIGGGLAMLTFAVAGIAARMGAGTAGADQAAALFGSFSLGWDGYAAIALQIALIAGVTALVSRRTVSRTLDAIE